jgi:hypothetical protein
MPNTKEKLIELLTAYFGVDPAYYGIEAAHLAGHLVARGVTVQSGIDANTFRLMRECERLKEEKESLANAVNVLEEINSDLYKKLKGVTVQEWIPVTERLPEDEKKVLCILSDGFFCILEWKSWDWLWDDGHNVYAEKDVTHWMPLPEAPKGE